MKISLPKLIFIGAMGFCSIASQAQLQQQTITLDNPENEPRPVHPLPHPRQVMWQETEFYAFFHFGMNTFTDREWGNGGESESTFAPTSVPNPRQWLETIKEGGMNGGIAVVKHHDGFCLWPTATTTHCVSSSSSANAQNTNIPRDFAAAAKDLGLKYGFYVSPWDCSSQYWGDGTTNYLDKVFLPQCEELAKYGSDQFEMWFDGASGGQAYYGGSSLTTRSIDPDVYYDMPNLRDKMHKIAPNMVMWGLGGEARWIGNELGWAGETCWSMGDGEYGDENGWKWHPGESDARATSAGWFWHSGESVKSVDGDDGLWNIYLKTVGRNATLILNFPPDRTGALPSATVNRIKEFGAALRDRLGTDYAPNAAITASETRADGQTRTYAASNMIDGDKTTYWAPNDGTTAATITLTWDTPQQLRYVTLMEYITLGQRVKAFNIEVSADGVNFESAATGVQTTTIGYKRIIPLDGNITSKASAKTCKAIRINITDAKDCPLFHTVSCY